jgi:pyruvate decarboxylase
MEFVGLYNGKLTPNTAVKQQLESADVILHIGPLPSDSNTGGWSQSLPEGALITLHYDFVSCGSRIWNNVHFAPVLKKLAAHVQTAIIGANSERKVTTNGHQNVKVHLTGLLEQHHFWREWSPFLRRGDLVIAEVGSAQYGTLELELPPDAEFITQLYYSSIGFSVGALLGALVARRENGKEGRVILFVGDGSLHMTVQVSSHRYTFSPYNDTNILRN